MNVSIELTFAPLQNDYEDHIKTFIRRLRESDFTLKENPLSTQIFGEWYQLMQFLTPTIEQSFDAIAAGMIHLKIVKSDRSDYQPFD